MFGDSYDSSDFFGGGSIDLSTVDPNPSLDQSAGASDSGSLDWINSLGQWGATITSIATRTPTQTNNRGLITGARQPSLLGSSSNSQMLLTVLVVALIAFVLISFAKKRG